MPAAIKFECEVSERGIADFVKALADYQRKTQRDMRGALRSATIDLCRSLRARTRKSKRFVELLEINKSDKLPKRIAKGNAGRPLRRMAIARYAKGKLYFDHRFVYSGEEKTSAKGKRRYADFSLARLRRDARQVYGAIRNWGLAKKSWGWFMHSLFKTAMQDENPKAVLDKRMVEGGMTEKREPLPDGTIDLQAPIKCDIVIVNKLDYIRSAMPKGVLAIAVQKATNSIRKKIESGLHSRKFGN